MDVKARYLSNLGALTQAECLALRQKKVLVAGCGGLGGYLLEYLLRLGVGAIAACDGDVFEAGNLNRQLLSTPAALGRSKAGEALRRAAEVNPEVRFQAVPEFLTRENAPALLAGCDLALDALDNVKSRQMLARACAALNIPLVHGAIQGWYAQVAVIPPGCDLLDRLYPAGEPAAGDKSSLAFTPALCAALQASEAVKLLCGRDSPLAGKLLCADLLNQDYEVLSLPPESV